MRSAKLILAVGLTALTLSACGGERAPSLMNLRSDTNGPDEFGILPVKPLEMPTDLANLPIPTPNGGNLVDPTPNADAIVALGGKPGSGSTGDNALISYATRSGVSADIRAALAAEDLQYRRANNGRLLERWFKNNVYFKAYLPQSLDQQKELAKWRARGVGTPSAPPLGQ
jgi:hypothetical protein